MIWPGYKLFPLLISPRTTCIPSGGFSSNRVNWVTKNRLSLHPASGNESWGCGRDPSASPRKSTLLSPWIGRSRTKVDVFRSWSLPGSFDSSICDWKNEFSLFGKYHLFRIESFPSRFPMRSSSPTPRGLRSVRHPSKFPPAYRAYPRNNPEVRLSFQIDGFLTWSFAVLGWCSTNEPNGIIGPFKWLAQNVFHWASSHQVINLWRFADRCNISENLPTNFHSDPIAAIQQRYLLWLCALALSAIPLVFWSVWCRRAMIPGEIFTSFAEFQGIVSVNDL